MTERVVIIQGSPSDDAFAQQIEDEVKAYGITAHRRTASAHRTSDHLNLILSQYDPSDRIVFVTVAGLSDALSGRVGADYSGRVIAAPPDAEKYGEMKVFSSTKTPTGIKIQYAINPQEAAALAVKTLQTYDWSLAEKLRQQAEQRRIQTILHDARQQGVEEPPRPYTVFKRGKTRDVYDLGDGTLLVDGTDRVSAFDVNMHERIPGKGQALTELSEHWFQLTHGIIPNHFIERVDERAIRVKKADRIGVEWIARGYMYGSLWRDYQASKDKILYGIQFPDGLVEAQELEQPVFTPTTKAEDGHDQPITKEEAIAQGLVRDAAEWDFGEGVTMSLYDFYRTTAKERSVLVADMKIELGRYKREIIQIDEPPNNDSARLWSVHFYVPGRKQEGHALDKESLRQYLIEAHNYRGDGPPPHLPELIVDQVSRRARGAAEILTGRETDITKFGLLTVGQMIEQLKVN